MEQSDDLVNLEDESNHDHTGFRDGNLFIVDLIPEMFDTGSDGDESYFVQCLQTYGRILAEKLSWNRRDWMGLVFLGANEWDMDPEVKNVLTVQKFQEITTTMLGEIMEMVENVDRYKKMGSRSEYPLHDVLWHAARAFDSVKVAMFGRQVILCTCRDNPLSDDEPERHRIRLRAKTFGDVNVKLRVLCLGNDWNHVLFYRDLEMLANNIDGDDVKPMFLENLEVDMRFDARTTSHLRFRIGDGLHVRTVISPFSSMTKYLKEVRLCKETNEVLDVFRHYGTAESFGDESDEESMDPVKTPAPENARKAITYGDESISFDLKEIRKIRMPCEPGITLLGFKKIALDLKYHISPLKFVGLEDSSCDEEKELFTALLCECETKKVMAICAVSERGGPYLAKMLPCVRYGGFYVYKIAYFEQVNNLDDYVRMWTNGMPNDDRTAVDEAGVALMKKVTKKLRIQWNPTMFRNPKQQAQLSYIQTLAFDAVAENVEDTTLPDDNFTAERLGSISTKVATMFAPPSESCVKHKDSSSTSDNDYDKQTKFDDYAIQGLIDSGRLKDCTVPILRSMARSIDAKTSGTKAELLRQIIEKFKTKK